MTPAEERAIADRPPSVSTAQFFCWFLTVALLVHSVVIWCLPSPWIVAIPSLAIALLAIFSMPIWWKRAGWRIGLIHLAALGVLLFGIAWTCHFDPYLALAHRTVRLILILDAAVILFMMLGSALFFLPYRWSIAFLLVLFPAYAANRFVKAYVRETFVNPPIHYELGSSFPDPDMAYRMSPYSRARHYYPTNPRRYFDGSAIEPISPWRAWQLRRPLDDFYRSVPQFSDQQPGWVRIDPGPVRDDLPKADFSFRDWPISDSHENRLQFRARADSPRRITVAVHSFPEYRSVHRQTVPLDRDWQAVDIRLSPAEESFSSTIIIEFDNSPIPVEFNDLSMTFPNGTASVDGRLTPYFVEYQINGLGFRGDRCLPQKSLETKRIVCLGDSFTFGQGVHFQHTFGHLLERHLSGRVSTTLPKPVEVINAGRCGFSTPEELACYRDLAETLKPDVVILQMSDNDTQDHLRNFGTPSAFEPVRTYAECVDAALQLASEVEAHGARLIIFLFRITSLSAEWIKIKKELKRLPASVTVVDLGEVIAPKLGPLGENYWLYCVHPIDQHPNELAHQHAAELLQQAIEKKKLLSPD
jgi:lysophospholipase L1-like esterase